MIPFIVTDAGFTAFHDGRLIQASASHPRYSEMLKLAHKGRWSEVDAILNVAAKIAASISTIGDVTVGPDSVLFKGLQLGGRVVDIIIDMNSKGLDIAPMTRFLDRVLKNPIPTAADELWLFLEKGQFPITEDGCFIAYKKVRNNWKDIHSNTVDYSPGKKPSMPRNECDPDRYNTCSRGLHFCSHHYLPGFSSYAGEGHDRVIMVKVAPEDVVAIPSDYNNSKGRAWTLLSLGEIDAPIEEWEEPVVTVEVGTIRVGTEKQIDLAVDEGWQDDLKTALGKRKDHVIDDIFAIAHFLAEGNDGSEFPISDIVDHVDADLDSETCYARLKVLVDLGFVDKELVERDGGRYNVYTWIGG